MKLRYGICLFSLFVLAAAAYYIGYQGLKERPGETLTAKSPLSEAVSEAAAEPQDVLRKHGQYVMEFYDEDTGETEIVSMELPTALEGRNEKEALAYLEEQEVSFQKQEPGFLRLELKEFTPTRLTVRKIYSSRQEEYEFYLTEENGMAVVYRSDGKTLYQNTNMPLSEFPKEIQEEIRKGYYIKNLTELYDLLENVTS